MNAYINARTWRPDGDTDTYWTAAVDVERRPLPHHVARLSWTATGYGARIPTEYVVRLNGRWRRVYCRCYSNIGTLYIGRLQAVGENLIVRIDQ